MLCPSLVKSLFPGQLPGEAGEGTTGTTTGWSNHTGSLEKKL